MSKNAALIPPIFGSESMNALHTGEYLTPNLAPVVFPRPARSLAAVPPALSPPAAPPACHPRQHGEWRQRLSAAVLFTEVTSDLYYKNGSLGRLEIPSLDLSVRIYQGTDSKTLAKGVGHFEDTSIWNATSASPPTTGRQQLFRPDPHAGHRGQNYPDHQAGHPRLQGNGCFKVSETDRGGLADSVENMLTLYTCVRNQRDQRWCVTAAEV